MEAILGKLGLERLTHTFEVEKISPDIVCKLSIYEMNCLGVMNRSDIMNLRTECLNYGCLQPTKMKSIGAGPPEFMISKTVLENLLETDFQIKEIAKLLSVSESTVYRRMRFSLRKLEFSTIDDFQLTSVVKEIVEEFPSCGEVILHQILKQRDIKVHTHFVLSLCLCLSLSHEFPPFRSFSLLKLSSVFRIKCFFS